MTERIKRLRDESLKIKPSISSERAELLTEFYREHDGKYSVPVMRARAFAYLCERKTITDPEEVKRILRHLVKIGRPPPGLGPLTLN